MDAPAPLASGTSDNQDDVRNRLLCQAVTVFDRKGYAAASVREIAEAAGVTKPTLYYHFGSKEGLLLAILGEAQREFSALLAAAAERRGSTRERIIALGEDMYRLFEHNVSIARVAHAIAFGPPELAPAFDLRVFEQGFIATIERILSDGVAAGEIREVPFREVALAIGSIMQGCNERQLHPSFKPVGIDVLGRLINLLFDGLIPHPRA